MDLIVRNVRLANGFPGEPVDIGVAGGKIVAIERGLAATAQTYDAGGCLACAGLVETHIHLDKSRIIDRFPPERGREISPMQQVAALKKEFTVEDVRSRAERTLTECILNGATRMRTQVEVDPGIGLRGFEGVHSLIADYKWAIDIEICVFPQDGLTNYPGTEELLVEALKRGAKVIGGAPRYDTDHDGQIRRIFGLAREFDVDIDIHLDVGNTPEAMDIHLVSRLTEEHRRGGRVVVGHMAKLSTMPPHEVAVLARRLADIGIAVTVLPATDLYLMGRDQDHNVRRGVADANFLVEHGVNCSLAEGGREAVAAMLQGSAAERPQRILQALGQCHEALTAEHDMSMLPAREGQAEVVEPVIQRRTGDADAAFAHIGEIGQPQPTRWMLLPEDDVLLSPVQRSPAANAPLQRAADAGADLGVAAADLVENGDRPQARNALEQRHHLAVPNRGQRILPPAVAWRFLLRREPGVLLNAKAVAALNPALAAATVGVSAWRKLMYDLIWQSVMWRPGKLQFLIGMKNPLPIRSTVTARQHGPLRGRAVHRIRNVSRATPSFRHASGDNHSS